MRRSHAILLLLVVATALTYSRVYGHEFVTWDDEPLIYDNPHLNPPNIQGLAWHWENRHMQLYIPVVYTAWWVLARLSEKGTAGAPLDPTVFHLANLLAHIACVLVVYRIIRLLVKSDWPACAGAMLFAVHPVQAEPVAWATGMKDVLSGLMSLLAVWQYLIYAIGESAGGLRQRPWRYPIATALFVLALLAKPSAVTVPLIAGALDGLLVRRPWKTVMKTVGPWLILSFAWGMWTTLYVQKGTGIDAGPIWARPLIAADALAFYLFKLVWPVHLGIDYGRRPAVVIGNGWIAWTWLLPALVAFVLWRLRRSALTAAGWIFVAALLPLLGLAPFLFQRYSTVADRYLYVAMLGPALALAAILAELLRRGLSRQWVAATPVLLLATLAARTWAQTGYWHDSVALYSHAVNVTPDSFVSIHNLAVVLDTSDRTVEALPLYERLLDPHNSGTYDDLALALPRVEQDRPDMASQCAADHVRVGQYYLTQGRAKSALNQFLAATRLDPENSSALAGLAVARADIPATMPASK